jgi:lambda family phage portal protein
MGMFDFFRRPETKGFEAAGHSRRLANFQPSRAHVNTLLAQAGDTVLARARHLVRNNGYAQNGVDAFASHLVGTGIRPNPGDTFSATDRKAVLDLWRVWVDEADAEGVTDFYGLERRVAQELFVAGECFVRFRTRRASDGMTVPLQLQIIPAEMLDITYNEDLGGRTILNGIEMDALGKRTAYHFFRQHPGAYSVRGEGASGHDRVAVPASDVLHIYDPKEAGQLRGVSRFAPVIVKMFTLDAYDDAELERKKTTAYFTAFVRRQESDPFTDASDRLAEDAGLAPMEPGLIQYLDDGEDITFAQPTDVGGMYEVYQYRVLLQIAAGLGVPYSYLTGDMLKANYSNTRASLVDFRRRMEAMQWSVMVHLFCRPVWERFLREAYLSNALRLPEYESRAREYGYVEWIPPKVDWVDPAKDAKAEIELINAGLKSRTQAIIELGYDPEQVDQEIAADKERENRLGLSFGDTGGGKAEAPSEDQGGSVNSPKVEGDE